MKPYMKLDLMKQHEMHRSRVQSIVRKQAKPSVDSDIELARKKHSVSLDYRLKDDRKQIEHENAKIARTIISIHHRKNKYTSNSSQNRVNSVMAQLKLRDELIHR